MLGYKIIDLAFYDQIQRWYNKMQITERKLRKLIKEQQEVLLEKRKFNKMLLEAGKGAEAGKMLKMAFSALKRAGKKAGPLLVQWLKSNPEMLEDVIGRLIADEKIKSVLVKAVKNLMTDENSSETEKLANSTNGVEKPVAEGS